MPPRFLHGVDSVAETLDEIARDCEGGEIQGIACVVVINGQAWRYASVPSDVQELVSGEIEELAADVEAEGR